MTGRVRKLKPWTQVATPHQDIVKGSLDMATYAADLGAVHRGDESAPAVYRSARGFFEQTYMTSELRRLLGDALSVLAGGPGDQILQLRTPFGGGKTHTLLALYHLATGRKDLAGMPDLEALADPGMVRVAVLSGVDLDPERPREHHGVQAKTLWGELAAQLGTYAEIKGQDEGRTAPGRDALLPALGEGPVLILMDELMHYVTRCRGVEVGDGTLYQQVMTFLQTLTETVRARPHTALVYSLQASVQEAGEDEAGLEALAKMVGRVDAVREPVSGDEVMRVVQTRLFANLGSTDDRQQAAVEYARLHEEIAAGYATSDDDRRQAAQAAETLQRRIADSYPFHPLLLDCMYHRWGSLPSYQKTRGALQFLASAVHALLQEDPSRLQPLIGPGDIPLADQETRNTFFKQVGDTRRQYDSPMDADITGTQARVLDVDRRIGQDAPDLDRLRVGTRLATVAMLHSFGAKGGDERGVSEVELTSAAVAPGLDLGVLQRALSEMRTGLLYLHSTGRLYRFEVVANLNKMIAEGMNSWKAEQVVGRLEAELGQALGGGSSAVLWPRDAGVIPDHEPRFRLVYMDSRTTSWGDGVARTELPAWLERRGGGTSRDYRNSLGFALMDSGAYNRAVSAIRTILTLEDMTAHSATHKLSPEQKDEVKARTNGARADLKSALESLYDRVALPVVDTTGQQGYAFVIEHAEGRLPRGDTVNARLMDLLRDRVFSSVTPEKLAQLVRLGDRDGANRFYACDRLIADAFSYFQFPKLTDVSAIRTAIARGIQGGVFGYVPLARAETDALIAERPDLVTIGKQVSSDEIDLGAGSFICTPSLAAVLSPAPPEPGPGPGPTPPLPPAPDPPAVSSPRSLVIRFDASGPQLLRVMPGLSNLAERSSAFRVQVVVEATATDDNGFDQAFLANGVREHFEEADVEWRPEASS